jgi:hypothetical protein
VLDSYAEMGVTRCVIGLPPAGRDTVLPVLDRATAALGLA